MLYRRNPFYIRRFAYPNGNMSFNKHIDDIKVDQSKELESIPLPTEGIDSSNGDRHKRPFTYYIENFIKRVPLEELLIFGLIFVLLNESFEDDLLFVVLIYILVAGVA